MQLRWTLAFASLLIVSLPVNAMPIKDMMSFADVEESGKPASVKPKHKLIIKLQPASQVVCKTVSPTGTRLKKRRCQTIAEWNRQTKTDRMRIYLIQS